jgi:hypothetical protein
MVETISTAFNAAEVEWHHIKEPTDEAGHLVDYEYTILGYDAEAGRLDMMMRFQPNGGCCERHNHAASTTTLILEGEQHLTEINPDGTRKEIVRKQGEYAIAPPDAYPHIERGGPQGCVLLLSMQSPTGNLFSVFDPEFQKLADYSLEAFVQRWDERPG